MLETQFATQIQRLKTKFGDSSYDEETTRLLWRSIGDADVEWFKRLVDQCISSRKRSDVPLPDWFTQQYQRELTSRYKAGNRKLSDIMSEIRPESGPSDGGWGRVCAALGPCESAWDAVERLTVMMKLNIHHGRDPYHGGLEIFRNANPMTEEN